MKPISFPKLTLPEPGSRVAPTLGHPLVDDYLESVHARLRPNSTLAVVYDLKLFFTVIGVDLLEVRRRHVLEFIRAQRTGSADATVVPIVRAAFGTWAVRRSDGQWSRFERLLETVDLTECAGSTARERSIHPRIIAWCAVGIGQANRAELRWWVPTA